MNCKNCNNTLTDSAKFCGKCGTSVQDKKSAENKTPLTIFQIVKKVFQIIAVILLVLSIGTMSSSYNVDGWLGTMHDIFTITIAITFITFLTKFWKNKKMHEEWFNWRWIIFLILLSVFSFGTIIFSQALTIAREKFATRVDSWAIYTAPNKTFSVRFPSDPVYDSKTQETENGTLKIDTYKQADHTASVLYAVNISEFPAGADLSDPNGMLENTVSLSAKNGTVLNSGKTTNNGYTAVTYLIEFNHPTEVSRIKGLNVLIGNRLYQLLTAYDKPQEGLLEYDKFVNSFQIK